MRRLRKRGLAPLDTEELGLLVALTHDSMSSDGVFGSARLACARLRELRKQSARAQ